MLSSVAAAKKKKGSGSKGVGRPQYSRTSRYLIQQIQIERNSYDRKVELAKQIAAKEMFERVLAEARRRQFMLRQALYSTILSEA